MAFSWRKSLEGCNWTRLLAVFASLLVAACGTVETSERPSVMEDAGAVPDHRRIIVESLLDRRVPPVPGNDVWTYLVSDPAGMGPYEISTDVRRVYAVVGWAWLTCVKASNRGEPLYVAVFIQNNRVRDTRAQVLSDQCLEQTYVPLRVAFPTARERSRKGS